MFRAVTIDFHDTIATCDEWFQLEVHDLVPAFLDWYAAADRRAIQDDARVAGQQLYRRIRHGVVDSGRERDAASCVEEVMSILGFVVPRAEIEEGLERLFRPTLRTAKPKPGIVESTKALHEAGIPLAVVSSAAYHPFLDWTLEAFGIADCFHSIVTSASTGYYKSSPCIYKIAAHSLGFDPELCIHVGDSERFDIESARVAGMKTVLIDWQFGCACESRADLRLHTTLGLAKALLENFEICNCAH